ncbi:MAG: helix-turn-helix transcriptional regulator [Elusimicrobia bacterium]|nr:helix-turn-helix transcriptional regulator [Elusimicrobiota bacterium]
MNINTISIIAGSRAISQSDLARMAGISRQAVSRWFRQGRPEIDVRASHLQRLSQALGASMDELSLPLPCLESPEQRAALGAGLLWDRLYPDAGLFAAALVRGEGRAVARLVEVYGFFLSARMLGRAVWDRFPQYKKYLPPVRRRQLEELWATATRLGWI